METIVQEVKKAKKRPIVKKVTKKQDDNLYTYVQMVEKKAYDLYEKRGCEHGRDQDDWFEAEKMVEGEIIAGKCGCLLSEGGG